MGVFDFPLFSNNGRTITIQNRPYIQVHSTTWFSDSKNHVECILAVPVGPNMSREFLADGVFRETEVKAFIKVSPPPLSEGSVSSAPKPSV